MTHSAKTGSIVIELRFDEHGSIAGIESAGHAVKRTGTAYDTCCALVSASLRSFFRMTVETEGLVVEGNIALPGRCSFRVVRLDPEKRDWYRGISDLTVRNLTDIETDFPGTVRLKK